MSLTTFAQRMKQAREKKGLKQNELAKAVGVTPTTISAYEKSDTDGNGKKPTLENAQAIAESLDVSLDWLCGMADTAGGGYTNLTAETYFKSLVNILVETSCKTNENGIEIENKSVLRFIKKVSDLINVYRAGSIPEDLFNVCIDKIIKDYDGYTVFGDCILSNGEAFSAESAIDGILLGDYEAGAGMYQIHVSESYGYADERLVSLYISPKCVEDFHREPLPKPQFEFEEVSDNGNNNPTN